MHTSITEAMTAEPTTASKGSVSAAAASPITQAKPSGVSERWRQISRWRVPSGSSGCQA